MGGWRQIGEGANRRPPPFLLPLYRCFGGTGSKLPYPSQSQFGTEISFVCALPFVEAARLFLGSMGNKTERAGPLVLSIVLSGPVIAMCIYYLTTQTYVLRVEQVLNGISLGFCGLQLLFSLMALVSFQQALSYA